MKRSFSLLLVSGTALIAGTYGLVRLAYGLYLPDVESDFGLDAAAAGAISSGASLVYCAGAVAGFLAANRHARLLLVAASASATIGAGSMALAPSAPVFGTAVVVASAGAGLASPALVRIVQRNSRPERADRAQSIVNAGTGPGLVVAAALALVLLPDWRTGWAVAAAVTAVAGTIVLAADRGTSAPTERAALPTRDWALGHGVVIAAALLMGAGSAAVWNSGRSLLVDNGAGRTTSILVWLALGVGGTAVVLTVRWTGRLRPSIAWTVATSVVAAATVALVLAPRAPAIDVAACAAFGWGYTAGTGALIAWTTRIDPDHAAAGTAMLFVVLVFGQSIGAVVTGALVSASGYLPAFAVAALTAAVAAALAAMPRRAIAHAQR